MACRHEIVIPNSLRGISPSYWPAGDGRMHFDGLCQECMGDVWRHARGVHGRRLASRKPWRRSALASAHHRMRMPKRQGCHGQGRKAKFTPITGLSWFYQPSQWLLSIWRHSTRA